MKPGTKTKAGDPSSRTLGTMVGVSLVLHLAVMLIPGAWWRSVPAGGPGERVGGESFVVSLVELPEPGGAAVVSPAPDLEEPAGIPPLSGAVPEPVEQEPEPETDPLESTPVGRSGDTPEPDAAPSPESVSGSVEGTPGRSPGMPESGAAGKATGSGEGDQVSFQGPRLLAGALPIDPKDAEALDVPPEIPVRLLIGIDGKVQEIVPLLDLPKPVLRAVEHSALAMRFSPARRGNQPVVAWFSMTFVYQR